LFLDTITRWGLFVGFSGHVGSGRSRPLRSRTQRWPRPFTAVCTYSAFLALLSRFFFFFTSINIFYFQHYSPSLPTSDEICRALWETSPSPESLSHADDNITRLTLFIRDEALFLAT
jgi:hypothetical protein